MIPIIHLFFVGYSIVVSIIGKFLPSFTFFNQVAHWVYVFFPISQDIFQRKELGITDELSPLALTFRAPIFQSLLKAEFAKKDEQHVSWKI